MGRMAIVRVAALAAWVFGAWLAVSAPAFADAAYPWPKSAAASDSLGERIAPPAGFTRVPAESGSFGAWLRGLPLKPESALVHLFDGQLKRRQDVQAAVIDIDTGERDLQQCADAVMRLRAEWLLASGRRGEIGFNFTGGGRAGYARYAKGERPNATATRWSRSARADDSYGTFRKYMDLVFAYAGTASLEKELKSVPARDVEIGDVFIKGGFPGHAVLVADVAVDPQTNAKRMLLIQSYIPAQDMHVLKNPASADGSPWYAVPDGALVTPEWTFAAGSLKRWP